MGGYGLLSSNIFEKKKHKKRLPVSEFGFSFSRICVFSPWF